jgi:hypothetical protein
MGSMKDRHVLAQGHRHTGSTAFFKGRAQSGEQRFNVSPTDVITRLITEQLLEGLSLFVVHNSIVL